MRWCFHWPGQDFAGAQISIPPVLSPPVKLFAIAIAARASMRGDGFDVYLADLTRLTASHGAAGAEMAILAARALASATAGEAIAAFVQSTGSRNGVSGYMYHSVPAVLHAWFTHPRDFAQALTTLIRCGGDTDTTAAMLGAIIGSRVGRAGIPTKWLNDLAEWPRTVAWIDALARTTAEAVQQGKPQAAQPLSIIGLVLRNAFFFVLVLAHGLRRLLPPY